MQFFFLAKTSNRPSLSLGGATWNAWTGEGEGGTLLQSSGDANPGTRLSHFDDFHAQAGS